jgi:hypothetical protein
MVKLALILVFLLMPAAAPACPGQSVRVIAELSKPEVYEGEQFTVQFLILAPVPQVEVEVAKFPEFRGFWSENLSLRQGPIALSPGPNGTFVGVVGSYLLCSMVDAPSPKMEPMKLLVRLPFEQAGVPKEQSLLTEGPLLKLKPLPPIPAAQAHIPFNGAVGKFSIFPTNLTIPFRLSDPAVARISLQGEGNFAEINEVPLKLPATMQLLSQRSVTQGGGNFVSKTFEISVSAKEATDIESPAQPYLTFNPTSKRYETLMLPAIRWMLDSSPNYRGEIVEPFSLPEPKESWTVWRSLTGIKNFWIPQLLVALMLFSYFAQRFARRLKVKFDNRPKAVWKRKLDSAVALASIDTPTFLLEADRIASGILKTSLVTPRPILSRKDLVIQAEGKHGSNTAKAAERIFSAYQRYAYSALKELPTDPHALAGDLHSIWQRAA